METGMKTRAPPKKRGKKEKTREETEAELIKHLRAHKCIWKNNGVGVDPADKNKAWKSVSAKFLVPVSQCKKNYENIKKKIFYRARRAAGKGATSWEEVCRVVDNTRSSWRLWKKNSWLARPLTEWFLGNYQNQPEVVYQEIPLSAVMEETLGDNSQSSISSQLVIDEDETHNTSYVSHATNAPRAPRRAAARTRSQFMRRPSASGNTTFDKPNKKTDGPQLHIIPGAAPVDKVNHNGVPTMMGVKEEMQDPDEVEATQNYLAVGPPVDDSATIYGQPNSTTGRPGTQLGVGPQIMSLSNYPYMSQTLPEPPEIRAIRTTIQYFMERQYILNMGYVPAQYAREMLKEADVFFNILTHGNTNSA